jgi:hypothetical protein
MVIPPRDEIPGSDMHFGRGWVLRQTQNLDAPPANRRNFDRQGADSCPRSPLCVAIANETRSNSCYSFLIRS